MTEYSTGVHLCSCLMCQNRALEAAAPFNSVCDKPRFARDKTISSVLIDRIANE